ncbi:MAG: LysE family transporter [Candidatus Methanomethylicia archaeon]
MDFSAILKVITISASGVLAPGPLTASSIALGVKNSWKAGVGIAFGHMIVEFPLVLLIVYGIGIFLTQSWVRIMLGLVGGLFLMFFAMLTFRDSLNPKLSYNSKSGGCKPAIAVGIGLSVLNPYFIAWWIGVGLPLILEVLKNLSLIGLIMFYIDHVWLDYVWLTFTSSIGSVSRINMKIYKTVLLILAVTVLYFGIEMIIKVLFLV